ncbi:MAG: hypothetical protein A4E66_02136 [Syntrophus sp. PtaB.Bin001]|nr:MAG: hypothetical protein A4E66_02136 [Syntrophus sp. PtaB.Bin001]
MRKSLKKFVFALIVLGLFFGSVGVALADLSVTSVDGDWANAVGGKNVIILNDQAPDGRVATASWGEAASWWNKNPARSSYVFESIITPFKAPTDGTAFSLGTFTHNNFPIPSGSGITGIKLLFNLGIEGFSALSTTFVYSHNETPNNSSPPSNPSNNDIVTITNPVLNAHFISGGNDYYFSLLGFSQDGGATISNVFSTIENQANSAQLYGIITTTPIPTPTPIPAAIWLLGSGLVGLIGVRRRFTK